MQDASNFVPQSLPAVSARRRVRQAHGRQRRGAVHARTITDKLGETPRDHGGRAGMRGPDVWRGEPLRRGLRRVSVADALFRQARVPHRLIPPAIALGAFTFTMTALPGTPAVQNAIPMPHFGTTLFAAPGLGLLAAATMVGFGLWWLSRVEARARAAGEGYSGETSAPVDDQLIRAKATNSENFEPGGAAARPSQQGIAVVCALHCADSHCACGQPHDELSGPAERGHRVPGRAAIQYHSGRGERRHGRS